MTAPDGVCLLAPVRGQHVDWDAAVTIDVHPWRPDPQPAQAVLTVRQRQILDFVRRYHETSGFSPSFREIADGVGLRSMSTVAYQVGELRRLGFLAGSDAGRRPRALRLVRDTPGVA